MVNIPRFHRGARGSIPRWEEIIIFVNFPLSFLTAENVHGHQKMNLSPFWRVQVTRGDLKVARLINLKGFH